MCSLAKIKTAATPTPSVVKLIGTEHEWRHPLLDRPTNLHVRLQNLKNLPPAFDFTEYSTGIFFQILWPSQKTSTYLIPEVPACGWLEKVPPAEPEVPGRAAEAPKSGALSLVSEVRNIWFLSPLVPSKREKNIQTETTCLSLYIF